MRGTRLMQSSFRIDCRASSHLGDRSATISGFQLGPALFTRLHTDRPISCFCYHSQIPSVVELQELYYKM
ncbi:hypothetical protein M758_10G143200 [Ceratodon purpureus]|nr:hypothetical protein M758_10G143200 [Ceratodon purpureus]